MSGKGRCTLISPCQKRVIPLLGPVRTPGCPVERLPLLEGCGVRGWGIGSGPAAFDHSQKKRLARNPVRFVRIRQIKVRAKVCATLSFYKATLHTLCTSSLHHHAMRRESSLDRRFGRLGVSFSGFSVPFSQGRFALLHPSLICPWFGLTSSFYRTKGWETNFSLSQRTLL